MIIRDVHRLFRESDPNVLKYFPVSNRGPYTRPYDITHTASLENKDCDRSEDGSGMG